jgi:hypothetical protein
MTSTVALGIHPPLLLTTIPQRAVDSVALAGGGTDGRGVSGGVGEGSALSPEHPANAMVTSKASANLMTGSFPEAIIGDPPRLVSEIRDVVCHSLR